MRLLFIGDIFGKVGRTTVKNTLSKAISEHSVDFVVANGENIAHGFGITKSTAKELFDSGVDIITGGNHSWDKPEVSELFNTSNILRPLNYSSSLPGKGVVSISKNGEILTVLNTMGHFGMPHTDNAIARTDEEIRKLTEIEKKNIFIDFHAESTSEKYAFMHHFASDISAIAGTHTHVGTDDLMVVNGTGYVSDVGLTGARDGVIGVEKEAPIKRLLTGVQEKLKTPDKAKSIFQAVIFEIIDGKCIDAFKIKSFCDSDLIITQKAVFENF